MNMNKSVFVRWTKSAIECFSIGCQCTKCKLRKTLETNCRMKSVVLELVRIHGRPKKDAFGNYISEEDIEE